MSLTTSQRVLVIGTGPAGATAAWQLVQRGIPVTVLESGKSEPEGLLVRGAGYNLYRKKHEGTFGSDCAAYHSSPSPIRWFMSLEPGGLSNQWTGAVPRFAPDDFFDGRRLHEKYDWPLRYEDLEKYYTRAERLMGIVAGCRSFPTLPAGHADHRNELPTDWLRVASGVASDGHGLTTLPLADGPPFLLAQRGTAFNSYTNIVRGLEGAGKVNVIRNAHALRLEWSVEQGRVTGVVFLDRSSGMEERIAGAAVVVCAGALNSTRLLMNSSCPQFPEGLGNEQGLLGRYLHDHTREWWVFESERGLRRLKPAAYLTRGRYSDAEPLMGLSWTIGTAGMADKILGFTPLKGKAFGVQVFGTVIPTEERRICFHPTELDPHGMRRINIKIDFNESEKKLIEGARDRFVELMGRAGYAGSIRAVEQGQVAPGVAVHYGGTARMHASRQYGVLDEWNRVRGVPNVVVGDAACFTTSPEKNPTLTAMALAARACDRLSDELKAGPAWIASN